MQNRWVGDVGDFGKYGLLARLCKEDELGAELKLGVVWYLVSEKGSEYLSEGKGRFSACDDELYTKLASIVQSRSVAVIEGSGVLPHNTAFFGHRVNGLRREDWLALAIDKVKDCEVVFLDPDTGLSESDPGGAVRGNQYAYLDEVLGFADKGNERTVVVYHHLGRQNHDAQIDKWLGVLKLQHHTRSAFAVRFRAYSARAFFVIPAEAHRGILEERAEALVYSEWGRQGLFEPRLFRVD